MKSDVEVSVVVSTHNRAQYLDVVLGSLAAQDCHAPFEVIVIDNASTDDTARRLESWCRKDRRFRTAYEPRPGLSCGKNAGIRLARGSLLLFTDDDTVVDPHWITAYLDLFARRGTSPMIAGGVQIPVPHDLGAWPVWFAEAAVVNLALLDYGAERSLAPWECVWGANMAIPRHVFHTVGLWDETVGRKGNARGTFEDTEFQDRVRAHGMTVWFCPDAIIRHRIARDRLTPRRIFSAAFARGRNQLWKRSLSASPEIDAVRQHNVFEVLCKLAAALLRWAFWVVAFRVWRRRGVFERARCAAYASGRTFEALHLQRSRDRFFEVVIWFVFGWRRVLLRLCSDSA